MKDPFKQSNVAHSFLFHLSLFLSIEYDFKPNHRDICPLKLIVLAVKHYVFCLQIAENDDLPHKICFRCSAKLEELYEFIQKCIKTQESLRTAVGKTGPFILKTKTRKAWENKLNKTNMSNDDICDALIKKAMEGIRDIPLKSLPKDEETKSPPKRVTRRTDPKQLKKEPDDDDNDELNLKEVKLSQQKNDVKVPSTKTTRSSNSTLSDSNNTSNKTNNVEPPQPSINKNQNEKRPSENKEKNSSQINSLSFDYTEEKSSSDNDVEIKETVVEKPFNIMDYISMIKVNGVGVLFQCKLCNRNFLKKEVVESHNCAKNGVPKVAIPKTEPTPEPPKVPTVKYITIEGNMKKPHSWKSYKIDNDNSNENKSEKQKIDTNKNKDDSLSTDINLKQEHSIQSAPPVKPKPKAGPASKTRRTENNPDPGSSQNSSDSQQSSTNPQSPSVQIPSAPNLNGRFKLVPGPNNIFTLVEDTAAVVTEVQKTAKKRKSEPELEKLKDRKKDPHEKSKTSEVIDIDNPMKPYPVGLFQTIAHPARMYEPPVAPPPAPFTTPAMKKQSYTIVQTGNPSKLLISTKAVAPPAEVPKKRQRKTKLEVKDDLEPKEPFRVTLEDVAHPKDTGFFTFINVDPLLQPSYVLPTDNIIQESQISTSTATIHNAAEGTKESKDKDKYPCNMCGDSFSREKKLLSHIQSHYSKMDEEDQQRAEKIPKKKGRRS